MTTTNFATWLRNAIDKRPDINQKKLSEILGVYSSTVHYWVTGRSEPNDESIAGISEVFGVDPMIIYQLLGRLPQTDFEGINLNAQESKLIKGIVDLRESHVYELALQAMQLVLTISQVRADLPEETHSDVAEVLEQAGYSPGHKSRE